MSTVVVTTAPRYAVGTAVKVNYYTGVLPSDYQEEKPGFVKMCEIVGIRLEPEYSEDDEGQQHREYPEGWEYLITHPKAGVWGWVSEAELMKNGY